jgi:hypothetical protein
MSIFTPRIAILLWCCWHASNVFETDVWPVLGFFFMPYTTCAYIISVTSCGGPETFGGLALIILGVLVDCRPIMKREKERRKTPHNPERIDSDSET